MVKNVVEDDEEFDSDFEDEEEENLDDEEEKPVRTIKTETRGRPRKEEARTETRQASVPKSKSEETGVEYAPFAVEARTGIMNKATREPIGEDVYTILAVVLNKLQKIEEAVC